jgi:endoglucanase
MRAVLLALAVLALLAPAADAERVLKPGVRIWLDPESSTAQVPGDDAQRLAGVPGATWLTSGSPYGDARRATVAATPDDAVPVLVAYNIPGRDCGEYSAGGAKNAKAYRSWIGELARGISSRRAAVILEPDAIAGGCTSRALIRGAVERLRRLRHTAVYIDAGHSHWHDARELAKRLKASGIARADGFALNVSNYRTNAELLAYGADVSKRVGGRHFVIDTSRNGQGPWTSTRYPDPQDWCNPPGRGLGERPTTDTGTKLLDAKLWIKTPGESDGQCTRGTLGPQDPEWGEVDPAAGRWFARQAAELIRLANPPL